MPVVRAHSHPGSVPLSRRQPLVPVRGVRDDLLHTRLTARYSGLDSVVGTRYSVLGTRYSYNDLNTALRACIKTPNGAFAGSAGLSMDARLQLLELLRITWSSMRTLRQLGVLCLRLPENRDVGVRVFPEREEILVGAFCVRLIARHDQGPAE
jgi:hypothetical protein